MPLVNHNGIYYYKKEFGFCQTLFFVFVRVYFVNRLIAPLFVLF